MLNSSIEYTYNSYLTMSGSVEILVITAFWQACVQSAITGVLRVSCNPNSSESVKVYEFEVHASG